LLLVVVVIGGWRNTSHSLLQWVDGQAKLTTLVEAKFGQVTMELIVSDDGGLAWVDHKRHQKGWRWWSNEVFLCDEGESREKSYFMSFHLNRDISIS